jgi:hypothetical protein
MKHHKNNPIALLPTRLALFLVFQAIVALTLNSWQASQKYWLLTATLTNVATIVLLWHFFRQEGIKYIHLLRVEKGQAKKDILIFLGILIITVPVVLVPGHFLSIWLWNDPKAPVEMMFGPMAKGLIYFLLIAFPVTIAFAELPFYFGYIMPKLVAQMKSKWAAVLLPVLFLSLQHVTLPFIADINFVIYRALVYLPLALLIGISIFYRPSLFLYFVILHGLMDFGAAAMFLMENQ